mmetsp:Transcript_29921/g.72839  ORF Transcript_29921/g.72839 Transcript_29921/m.72839 type:complete len:275 (+) Transcript_29921:877-1701(+)
MTSTPSSRTALVTSKSLSCAWPTPSNGSTHATRVYGSARCSKMTRAVRSLASSCSASTCDTDARGAAAAAAAPTTFVHHLRIGVVCASNQNRSMAAHKRLLDEGYTNVYSYGTGKHCRLPGPSIDRPNVYGFGTPYADIHADLSSKDAALYARIGLLDMTARNASVKRAPERFQDEHAQQFDIVICYEPRVFDAVVEDLSSRPSRTYRSVHVIGLPVKDNRKEAERGADDTVALLARIGNAPDEDWENDMERALADMRRQLFGHKQILYSVHFY